MKTSLAAFVIASGLLFSCSNSNREYVDLNNGEKITVEKDNETGFMVNATTKKPVYLYADPEKRDTFYGRTGKVVNTKIERNNGRYQYLFDDEYVYSNGTYRVKTEADGEVKVKDGDEYKMKIDEDGSMKVKGEDYKKKVDEDGSIKIKSGDTKIKIDEDGKRKVKKD